MLKIAEIDLADDAEARDLLVLLESYATDPMAGDQAQEFWTKPLA